MSVSEQVNDLKNTCFGASIWFQPIESKLRVRFLRPHICESSCPVSSCRRLSKIFTKWMWYPNFVSITSYDSWLDDLSKSFSTKKEKNLGLLWISSCWTYQSCCDVATHPEWIIDKIRQRKVGLSGWSLYLYNSTVAFRSVAANKLNWMWGHRKVKMKTWHK